jgi:hypothetical protein
MAAPVRPYRVVRCVHPAVPGVLRKNQQGRMDIGLQPSAAVTRLQREIMENPF